MTVYVCSNQVDKEENQIRRIHIPGPSLASVSSTNRSRALSILLCSDWSIRWLKEEEEEMNCHLLIMSRRTDKGRDKKGNIRVYIFISTVS